MCPVRSLALANYLCGHGYEIKKVIDSEKNPQYKIFYLRTIKLFIIVLLHISQTGRCRIY